MSQLQIILTVVIVAVIVGFAMFVAGFLYRKKVSEKQIGSAKEEAKRIINDAIKTAETRKKEALLEAKEELLKERTDQEKELKERRVEVTRQEKRLQQREEILDKKYDNIDRKEEVLAEKQRKVEQLQEEVENVKKSQIAVLERISGYTADAAKAELLHMMDSELEHEYA